MIALTNLQIAGGLALPAIFLIGWIFTDLARARIARAKRERSRKCRATR